MCVCVYGVRAGDHVRQVVVPILLPHLYVNALQAGWVFVLVYGGLLSVFALLVWNLAVSVNYGMKLSACSFLCVNVAVAVRAPTRWGGSAEGSPPFVPDACVYAAGLRGCGVRKAASNTVCPIVFRPWRAGSQRSCLP